MYKEDTIAAVATPVGEGGVAIVRISGPQAERIAREIFARSGGRNGSLRSHTLHHGIIREPKSGEALDEVLLTLMRKPHSYTGEDVVEVHCHGGPYLVREVLRLILSLGARHAEQGEFTKRGFLNGRLDLAQAEGVLDLIRARTDKGMRLALAQVRGELSKWVGELREELVDILVQVEAAIDFPEEEIELLHREELTAKVETLKKKISGLIATYDWGRLFREGVRICIAGRPNVGKSSLLNALLGEERAIVTPVPGTTRDFIEETVNLGGLPVVLWDTAGICEGRDEVERMGVDFSLKKLKEAQGVVVVLDGSFPITPQDASILVEAREKKGVVVINKIDLHQKLDTKEVTCVAPDKEIISVSAKEGRGLDDLKQALNRLFLGTQSEPSIVVTNLRHKAALERSEKNLTEAHKALGMGLPPEMVAVDLQETQHDLEEIIGIVTNNDILERIFSKFCIGK
ncbi:MAG: tRNA uridine-5-carboxymethylaminomethyl(34) synthesis GTPase MnmE [Deltaproteobacteria bacterium]|nr:tRNA uridine-5-carboxymethylaminomethyl(34) synthesis GTPase MnmE [Deltaproteobacteria bacterium]